MNISKCIGCEEVEIEDDNVKCLYVDKAGHHESYPEKCPRGR